jgi:hypothetical protein
MVKLKDFVTSLAKKAGFDVTSATAKPFFDALPDTEVPEDVQLGIDNSLISLTEAKNNHPDIQKHYVVPTLNSVDKVLEDLMKDFELDDATKAEILAEKSTFKRVPLLQRRVVELERKKVSATSGKDKQEIQKQIDDLHNEAKAAKEELASKIKEFEQIRTQDRINNKKTVLFSGLKTIHDELDPETRFTIIDSQLQKELQDRQAVFTLDDNGNVVLMRKDGTNFFGENHQVVKPAQFIESVLAKNKQLKVTPSGSANGANNGSSNGATHSQPAATSADGKQPQSQNAVIDRNKQAAAEYEAATKNGAFGNGTI